MTHTVTSFNPINDMPVTKNEKATTIDCFQNDDNCLRVVYRYGCLKKNPSYGSSMPLVQILFLHLDKNGHLDANRHDVIEIEFSKLYKFTIGSLWRGNQRILSEYNFGLKYINSKVDLYYNGSFPNFFLRKNKNIENYNPMLKEIDTVIFSKLGSFGNGYTCVAQDQRRSSIYISCIQLLKNVFPNRLDLTLALFTQPITEILDKYFCDYRVKPSIQVTVRKKYKKLNENHIYFLAKLALDPNLQKTIELLQMSLELVEFGYDPINAERHPIAYPQNNSLLLYTKGMFCPETDSFYVTKIVSRRVIYNHTPHVIRYED